MRRVDLVIYTTTTLLSGPSQPLVHKHLTDQHCAEQQAHNR